MRYDTFIPTEVLRPYIRQFAITESATENEYKVFPSTRLVVGFQYQGQLSAIVNNQATVLATSGITGIADSYKQFRNTAGIGTVLVYFTETGFAHFASHPAHELFNQSLSLDNLFATPQVKEIEEKLAVAKTDPQRIQVVERFFASQLKDIQTDKLIVEAVKIIYQSQGTIRIRELNERLHISQSPFEKRFRKLVGTTPKKFASIVRFNTVLSSLDPTKSLADICYENHFFDQAHFIKDFKHYTGETPENFKRSEAVKK